MLWLMIGEESLVEGSNRLLEVAICATSSNESAQMGDVQEVSGGMEPTYDTNIQASSTSSMNNAFTLAEFIWTDKL
jgi:hypothetical protein